MSKWGILRGKTKEKKLVISEPTKLDGPVAPKTDTKKNRQKRASEKRPQIGGPTGFVQLTPTAGSTAHSGVARVSYGNGFRQATSLPAKAGSTVAALMDALAEKPGVLKTKADKSFYQMFVQAQGGNQVPVPVDVTVEVMFSMLKAAGEGGRLVYASTREDELAVEAEAASAFDKRFGANGEGRGKRKNRQLRSHRTQTALESDISEMQAAVQRKIQNERNDVAAAAAAMTAAPKSQASTNSIAARRRSLSPGRALRKISAGRNKRKSLRKASDRRLTIEEVDDQLANQEKIVGDLEYEAGEDIFDKNNKKKGMLTKSASKKKKGWSDRYFELDGKRLRWWKRESEALGKSANKKVAGEVYLEEVLKISNKSTGSTVDGSFDVVMSDKDSGESGTFTLYAANIVESDLWKDVLKTAWYRVHIMDERAKLERLTVLREDLAPVLEQPEEDAAAGVVAGPRAQAEEGGSAEMMRALDEQLRQETLESVAVEQDAAAAPAATETPTNESSDTKQPEQAGTPATNPATDASAATPEEPAADETAQAEDTPREKAPTKRVRSNAEKLAAARLKRASRASEEGKKPVSAKRRQCPSCQKRLYKIDKTITVTCDGESADYHKLCLRCVKCKKVLTAETMMVGEQKLYCKFHYKRAFPAKAAAAAAAAATEAGGEAAQSISVANKPRSEAARAEAAEEEEAPPVAVTASKPPKPGATSPKPVTKEPKTEDQVGALDPAQKAERRLAEMKLLRLATGIDEERCGACLKVVDTSRRFVEFDDLVFHVVCLKCSRCRKKLSANNAWPCNKKWFCNDHVDYSAPAPAPKAEPDPEEAPGLETGAAMEEEVAGEELQKMLKKSGELLREKKLAKEKEREERREERARRKAERKAAREEARARIRNRSFYDDREELSMDDVNGLLADMDDSMLEELLDFSDAVRRRARLDLAFVSSSSSDSDSEYGSSYSDSDENSESDDAEEVFEQAGEEEGLWQWRIVNFAPVRVAEENLGIMFSAESYIVLASDGGRHHLYYWVGNKCPIDKKAAASLRCLQKSKQLRTTAMREEEGDESKEFRDVFPLGLEYSDGAHGKATYFRKAATKTKKRMFRLKGPRAQGVRMERVEVSFRSLNSGDCFVLDTNDTLFQWNGHDCNKFERERAMFVAQGIKHKDRCGRPEIVICDDGEEPAAFWRSLGGAGIIGNAEDGGDDAEESAAILEEYEFVKVSFGEEEKLKVESIAHGSELLQSMLESDASFVLDCVSEIFVWNGRDSPRLLRVAASSVAEQFLRKYERPDFGCPIIKETEGLEKMSFKMKFKFWRVELERESPQEVLDRLKKIAKVDSTVDLSDIANEMATMQQAARVTSNHALTQAEQDPVLQEMLEAAGTETRLQIFRMQKGTVVPELEEHNGVFYNKHAYVCCCFAIDATQRVFCTVYFWEGSKCGVKPFLEYKLGFSKTLEAKMSEEYGRSPIYHRIQEGKEPVDFLKLFASPPIVRRGFVTTAREPAVTMFHVHGEDFPSAVEIKPTAKLLNPTASFIVIDNKDKVHHVWNGANAKDSIRAAAATVAGIFIPRDIPDWMLKSSNLSKRKIRAYEEGKESGPFWKLLGGKQDYMKHLAGMKEEPATFSSRLFHCTNATGVFKVNEVPSFRQSDLLAKDVYILDCFAKVHVWVGPDAGEKKKKFGIDAASKFIEMATDGREPDECEVVTVQAGEEPEAFTCRFQAWVYKAVRDKAFGDVLVIDGKEVAVEAPKKDDKTTCDVCGKQVYKHTNEGIEFPREGLLFHRATCYRCSECNKTLKNGEHHFHEEKLYCPRHFKKKFGKTLS